MRRKNFVFLVLILFAVAFIKMSFAQEVVDVVAEKIDIGSTKTEVIAAYGQPSGKLQRGNETTTFIYPGGDITLQYGRVEKISSDFEEKFKKRKQFNFKKFIYWLNKIKVSLAKPKPRANAKKNKSKTSKSKTSADVEFLEETTANEYLDSFFATQRALEDSDSSEK